MITQKSKAYTVARFALGALFFVFGLNGFLQFLPQPAPSGLAAVFLGGLGASGYMFPLIKGVEVAAGLLLLAGRYVPLALLLLAPIVVNILAFHAFLAPAGMAIPLVTTALGLYLAYAERAVFAPLFQARSEAPAPGSTRAPLHARAAV